MGERATLRRGGVWALALLAYFSVAVGMTWPLAARSGTHLVGESWDTLVHYWNGWWAEQALATGQSPFHTMYLFYPAGISLVYHNFAWLSIAEWLILKPLVGGLAAYNLSLLVNLALCGLAAFLLVRDVTGDSVAAFLAGLIYECWPFRLSQLGHPNMISTQWIPIYILFIARAVRRGRPRDGALAGAFVALAGYTRWQQLIPAAIVSGVYLACTLPGQWAAWRRWAAPLLLAGLVAALALAPPAALFLNQQRSAPADLVVKEDEALKQTDLLAYLTPSRYHPGLGALTWSAYDRYYAHRGGQRPFAAYTGVTVLLLAVLGLRQRRRAAIPWAATGLVLILLALGPVLRVGGQPYSAVPMLYRLASRLWMVRLLRFPERFNMFLALPVAVLAGHGLAWLLERIRDRRQWATAVAACVLGATVLFEYLIAPIPLNRPQWSPFYAQLADETGNFAVLNLPIHTQKSKLYMFAQVVHHRPILQGKTARFPEGAFDYMDGHPWLSFLRQHDEMPLELSDVGRQLSSLAEDGVRYIIVHKTQVGADRMGRWRRYLLIRPRYEDDQIVAYTTAPQAGRDFALAHELAAGIGIIRAITSTGCLHPGGVLEVDAGWGTTAAPGQDLQVELGLVSSTGDVSQAEVFPLSDRWPASEWPESAVAWGYYALRTNASLPAGVYTVTLALVDLVTRAVQGQAVTLGQVVVSASPCPPNLPAAATAVDASFGDKLRLRGYQLERDGDRLQLTLHWQSQRRMQTDYKIFVHVFELASTAPVAQHDAMPRGWAYPTTLWPPGDQVEDVMPVSLEGVPSGVYGVAVGVYDLATLERLPVTDGVGQPQPDGRFVLPGEMIQVEEHGP